MKVITKSDLHHRLLDKVNEQPPTNSDEAARAWSRLKEKDNLQQLLLDEQYQLCCYSEVRADLEELGYYIEHIKPKSKYPEQTFDCYNLAVSAIHGDKLAQLEDIFGGHAKLSEYDETLFVSCLQAGCERYFRYLSDGRVVPSSALDTHDISKAKYTIDLLNLNSPFLINRRKKWWGELDELVQEHLDNDMDLSQLASVDLVPTRNKLSPFFSLTRQFFANQAETVFDQFPQTDFDHAFQWPTPPKIPTQVGDILQPESELAQAEMDNGKDKYTISDKLWSGHQKRKAEHKTKGNGFGYSLFNAKSEYTSTISARYYKDGSEILIDQSHLAKNPRKLTPRECARLQGFP